MDEINTITLINSVKIRPALYNKNNCMFYSNRKFKYKLWREVCQEVYKSWDQYTPQEKLEHARELQKCWKGLRACFSRELALQKKEKIQRENSNEPVKKRKKYEYFNLLIFLLHPDSVQDYDTSKDSESETEQLEAPEPVPVVEEIDSTCQQTQNVASAQNSAEETVQQETHAGLDEQLLQMFRDYRKFEDDEDRQFLLCLTSMFRKLDDKKKLEARIEVLKLLQRIIYRVDDAHNQYI